MRGMEKSMRKNKENGVKVLETSVQWINNKKKCIYKWDRGMARLKKESQDSLVQ